MTSEPEHTLIDGVVAPSTAKCCFTELKLSLSRRHARRYGRLGIGVKRSFLFDRDGRPISYFSNRTEKKDRFLTLCGTELSNKDMLLFFKPMHRDEIVDGRKNRTYDLYSESEWRIIYSRQLEDEGLVVDPCEERMPQHRLFLLT